MKKKSYLNILMGTVLLAVGVGCSEADNNMDLGTDDGTKVRRLTITQIDDTTVSSQTEGGSQQASIREENRTLSARWIEGDKATYCNLSRLNIDQQTIGRPTYGDLMAETSAVTSSFSGTATIGANDYLALVYPSTSFGFGSNVSAQYQIRLSGQDGTLEKLAANFHYVYGVAKVTSVTETTAEATIGQMKSLLTVCKFSFVDENSNPIMISAFDIRYGGAGLDAGKYPSTATVTASMQTENVSLVPDEAVEVLSISPPRATDVVYVALLPTDDKRIFVFNVQDESGNKYSGEARAKLNAGQFVFGEGLILSNL